MDKIIHRLWLGPNPMPEAYVSYGLQFQEMNPDWKVIEWTQHTIPELKNKAVWDAIGKNPRSSIPMEPNRAIAVQRSDVVYYELVERFGGIALNVDIEPLRPMNELLQIVEENAWATYEDDRYLVNCAYGGPKEHPFWAALVEELPRRYFSMSDPKWFMQHQTGPHLLSEMWHSRGDILALPKSTFNYVYHFDIPAGGNASRWRKKALEAGAFGLHHWSHREDQGKYV